jgi:hypothetical protein
MASSGERAVDDAARGVVAPHRVYRYSYHPESLRLVDGSHLAAAVIAAMRAGAVRLLRLAAMWALAGLRHGERVMSAALGGA